MIPIQSEIRAIDRHYSFESKFRVVFICYGDRRIEDKWTTGEPRTVIAHESSVLGSFCGIPEGNHHAHSEEAHSFRTLAEDDIYDLLRDSGVRREKCGCGVSGSAGHDPTLIRKLTESFDTSVPTISTTSHTTETQ